MLAYLLLSIPTHFKPILIQNLIYPVGSDSHPISLALLPGGSIFPYARRLVQLAHAPFVLSLTRDGQSTSMEGLHPYDLELAQTLAGQLRLAGLCAS